MLQLILGRAGSGKTEYVFSSIKKLVDNNEQNILLITPEQFSFIAERKLLTMLGETKVDMVESSSFSRLCVDIKRVYGGDALPVLSKGGKAIMMKKAIDSVRDSLVLYSNSCDTNAFINSVIRIYDEMKSCRVSVEDIVAAGKNVNKEILAKKLSDISSIIGAYDALIANEYFDSANELTRLYEKLLTLDYFKDRIVFIDGFSGFVAQEYKVLEVVLKQAKAVYITLCTDSFNNDNKQDLFSYVNANIDILKDVAKSCNAKILSPIVLNKNFRAKNEELSCVEKYAFSNTRQAYNNDINNVSVYPAKSVIDECDYVSAQISKLLRKGYKASDIAVICRDLDTYENQIKFSFNKYHIPYFNDQRQAIDTQPLFMFVNFLLRIGIYSFRSDDIFSFAKTGLTNLDSQSIADLENYVYTWQINGSKWKKPFVQSTKGFVDEISDSDQKRIDLVNKSRDYIISRLIKFVTKSKNKSCKEISKNIYYCLLDFDCDKKLAEIAKMLDDNGKSAIAKEQGRLWDLLMDILNQIAVTSSDQPITLKDYYKLFNLVISNEDLGILPQGLDNVQFGSADRMRTDNPKAVFVIGANEGAFPQAVSSSGLLTESDRTVLKNNDFKLYSYGETLNAQEKYFAYMAVSCATDKLYVSFVQGNEKNTESLIVSGIEATLTKLKRATCIDEKTIDALESDDNAFEILASNFSSNDTFTKSLKQYFNCKDEYKSRIVAIENIVDNKPLVLNNKSLARKIYGDNMYLSASRVENYYNCAFSYFCKYGIGAKPRQKAEMNPMQTGTVVHYVLEQIIKVYGTKKLLNMTIGEIKSIVDFYLKDFLENKMGDNKQFNARFNYQFLRLSKMLVAVVIRLQQEFAQCDFEPKAFELPIGDGGVECKEIMLDNGCKISIHGAVDRVDTYEQNGEKYIRVIDYKSGTKVFNLTDILYGINLQMFIYLYTICNSTGEFSGLPAGVLYLRSSRDIYSVSRNLSDVNKKENSHFKMQGIVLNDEQHEIAVHMERQLEGKYIPANFRKKDATISGSIASLEEMGSICNHIDKLIAQMGNNLYNGVIEQNPIHYQGHDKTCEFCDYQSVCKNRKDIILNEKEKLVDSEAMEIIKGGSNNG